MKVAFLQPPLLGSFRGVNFYAERLLPYLQQISGVQVLSVPYSPFASYDSYDLVHSPFFEPYFFSLPILAKAKLVVSIHDATRLVFPDKFPAGIRGKTEWAIQRLLLPGKVAHIITDSQTSMKDISRLYPWPEEKITSVYLAADRAFKKLTKINKNLISKYHLPKKFLLYVGGANWNKNVLTLCQATQELNLPLVIVGKEWVNSEIDLSNIEAGPVKQVREYTRNNPRFIFPGFVPTGDLVEIYNLAAVYVQPSIYEGFGLPVLEAMSCATPVVCGQNSSLKEIAGDAALFANVTDPTDLASTVTRLLTLPSGERENIQKRGLAQAAKFSWEKTAENTYATYRKVLAAN